MSKSIRQVTDEVKALADNDLAHYIAALNLKWIESLQELSIVKKGTRKYRDTWLRHKSIMDMYAASVRHAAERGTIIIH